MKKVQIRKNGIVIRTLFASDKNLHKIESAAKKEAENLASKKWNEKDVFTVTID